MLVNWHLAPPVLSSKPAAYLSSGLICPHVFLLNLILPGSRIILKAKNNMDVTLAGFCQVIRQRGVNPCRSAWSIYRPSAKVPRLSSSTSSCEGWRNWRRGSVGNGATKATAEKPTHLEEDEGAQRHGAVSFTESTMWRRHRFV